MIVFMILMIVFILLVVYMLMVPLKNYSVFNFLIKDESELVKIRVIE